MRLELLHLPALNFLNLQMKINKVLAVIAAVGASLIYQSCSTDLVISAPYKETTIVYGLLNPDTSTQVIRISKAFVGEGNAYDFAKIPDSSNYKPGDLSVTLERLVNGIVKQSIKLRDSLIQGSSDIFSGQNMVYLTNEAILQDGSTYRLKVKNLKTQNEVVATTPVIGSFLVKFPNPNPPGSNLGLVVNGLYNAQSVSWQKATNAYRYDSKLRWYYTEVNKSDTNQKVTKFIELIYPSQFEAEKATIDGRIFYEKIQSTVQVNTQVYRKIGKPEVIFTLSDKLINDYVGINKPSTGLIQIRADYHPNISNGLGLFASRLTKIVPANFNVNTVDSIVESSYTHRLNFVR